MRDGIDLHLFDFDVRPCPQRNDLNLRESCVNRIDQNQLTTAATITGGRV
jgi:hypothetical protein